ncbi:MAG: hypothetical protein P8J89_02885 [Phycisphaerales bacterium]|nr:hypothetical protein [Phycisphaerales bacterium]
MNAHVSGTLMSLLDGVIDYAGLFPPASCSMEEMVANFASGLGSEADWMIGRVIVPLSKLDAFEAAAGSLLPKEDHEDPWCLSVLVSPAGSDQLEKDIETLAQFNERHCEPDNGLALADVIELQGPSADAIDDALDLMPDDLFPFFELDTDQDVRGLLAALAGSDAAAKIRTGGIKPELNPSTQTVARFIHQSVQSGVAFKATAGLHHPLPNENSVVPAHQQGFLNVFTAAALAQAENLDVDGIIEVLDMIEGFEFGEEQMKIGQYTLSREQIEDSRAMMAVSFGSCSWQEPLDDLKALGFLPRSDTVQSS